MVLAVALEEGVPYGRQARQQDLETLIILSLSVGAGLPPRPILYWSGDRGLGLRTRRDGGGRAIALTEGRPMPAETTPPQTEPVVDSSHFVLSSARVKSAVNAPVR